MIKKLNQYSTKIWDLTKTKSMKLLFGIPEIKSLFRCLIKKQSNLNKSNYKFKIKNFKIATIRLKMVVIDKKIFILIK